MNSLFLLIMWVPQLPLLAAAGIGVYILAGQATVSSGDDGEPPTARLAEGAAWVSLLLILGLALLAFVDGAPGHLVVGEWFSSGDIALPLSFQLDAPALAFSALVALIGVVALRFSRNYLHREPGFHRFFLGMTMFLGGMQLIVLAGDAVLAFVGWELCGLSSWLLIGYAYERPTATGNALFAFIANRIGDAGFLLGIAIAVLWLGGTAWADFAAWTQGGDFDRVTARLLLFGFLLAAVAKSAQIPFAPWIGRALEGPTPSSAIFYGAVMVHAGVWLLIRLEPVLLSVPDIMTYVALVGLATAVYGALGGLVQADVKSALMFGTTTQVGLMFLACGLGWFGLATAHLMLHAAWRAWQFLAAPSYMHLAGKASPAPRWLAKRQWLYTAALQRFWLDHLAQAVLVRPARRVGDDLRDFDDRALAHLVGMPSTEPVDAADDRATPDEVIRGHGLAGRLLLWVADHLHRFETHLILRGGGGPVARALGELGGIFRVVEEMLEQPRYLLLILAATFVVIL